MTTFPPLAKTAATDAERMVAQAASVAARPIDAASWDELVARSAMSGEPSRARLVPLFMLAFAAGVAAVLMVARPEPRAPALPPPQLVASAGAKWTQSASDTVVLSAGRLSMVRAGAGPVRIETPHAVIEVRQSRFLAEVIASGTSIVVEEGEVVLRSGSTTRIVHAGESIVWPPSPEIPAALLAAPAPTQARCAASPEGERRGCLEAEAATSSLDAQAAIYELGALEAKSSHPALAIAAWQQSLSRFPDGVVHPEVRLALLIELVRARRFADAEVVARGVEETCASDPRRAEVATLRALLAGP